LSCVCRSNAREESIMAVGCCNGQEISGGGEMFFEEIMNYKPVCEQEERDRAVMLDFIRLCRSKTYGCVTGNVLTRENAIAHMTASSMIYNHEQTKVLMVYHNLYDSWSWTGGHADGCSDLLAVAVREAKEETGLLRLNVKAAAPVSLDILQVTGHVKKGVYVSPHLHFNLTYALEADEADAVRMKPDENKGVMWISVEALPQYVSEVHMLPVYNKILKR